MDATFRSYKYLCKINLIFSLLVSFNKILVGSNLFVPKRRNLTHGTNKFEPTKNVCVYAWLLTYLRNVDLSKNPCSKSKNVVLVSPLKDVFRSV